MKPPNNLTRYFDVKKRGAVWIIMAGSAFFSMQPRDDSKPRPEEIDLQLQRIAESRYLRRRKKLTEVLTLLVAEAKEGRTLDEKDILDRVFGYSGYSEKASNARTAIHAIRRVLREYYAKEGVNDLVEISMPKRQSTKKGGELQPEAYPITLVYNHLRKGHVIYGLALQQMRLLMPEAVSSAARKFDVVVSDNPEHLQARLARLECLCIEVIHESDDNRRIELLNSAIGSAKALVSGYPEEWRAQLFLGITLFFRSVFIEALNVLTEVVRHWPTESTMSLWVATAYLLMNEPVVATRRTLRIAAAREDDIHSWVAYGLCLYFQRDFAGAENILLKMQDIDPSRWIVYLALALVYLAMDQPRRALTCHNQMRRITIAQEIMPGLGLLAAYRAYPGESDTDIPQYLLNQRAELLKEPITQKDLIQIAMIIMDGHPDSAVTALTLAWQNHNPLALLIPLWPVFDPLRGRADFQDLVARIGPRKEKV